MMNQTVLGSTVGAVLSSVSPCESGTSYLSWYRVNVTADGFYRIAVSSPVANASVHLYISRDGGCGSLTCLTSYGFVNETGALPQGVVYLAVSTGNVTAGFSLSLAENSTGFGDICSNFTQQFQEALQAMLYSQPVCQQPSFLLDINGSYPGCPADDCLFGDLSNCTNPCPCLDSVVSFLEASVSELAFTVQVCGPLPSIGTCSLDRYRQFTTRCGMTPRLDAVFAALSPNGDCEQASPLQVPTGNITFSGSTFGRNASRVLACDSQQRHHSPARWYNLTVSESMTYTFEVKNASFDTVLSVMGNYYAGPACGSSYCMGSNDDITEDNNYSRVTVYLEPNIRYYLVVQGYDESEYGEFTVVGYPGSPPYLWPGDSCASPIEVYPGLMVAGQTFSTLYPTRIGPCGDLMGLVVWFELVIGIGNVYTIEAQSWADLQLALYSGRCDQLTCMRTVMGNSSLTFSASAEETYYLAVSTGGPGSAAAFNITLMGAAIGTRLHVGTP
eukprot:jgi/Mesvir1/12077/Mv00357-RA.1